jgi:hypothetical protein
MIKDACFSNIAVKKTNPDICAMISSQLSRDLCYSSVALASADFSICNRIEDPNRRKNCP